jgi:hypothetical protein
MSDREAGQYDNLERWTKEINRKGMIDSMRKRLLMHFIKNKVKCPEAPVIVYVDLLKTF